MLESIYVTLLVSTVLGFLTGLGIGGGSLLIVWLTVVCQVDPAAARGINLLFFLPAALAAIMIRHKTSHFPIRPLLPAIVAGCISAAVFSFVSVGLDTALLKKGFGVLLLLVGIRELFYRPRKAR